LYRENIAEPEILAVLDPLLARYAGERETDEGFGDFLLRAGVIAARVAIPLELQA
jgi:sulfite reductase (NADPH) hemoprotein beta-component